MLCPIEYSYDKGDELSFGYAHSEEEAIQVVSAPGEIYDDAQWEIIDCQCTTVEAAKSYDRTPRRLADTWALEIELGYARVVRGNNCWFIEIHTYTMDVREREAA